MSIIVRAAAVQISPVLYSPQGTVEKVVKKIRELGKQGVQFATFPETVVPYYPYFSFIQAPIEHRRSRATKAARPGSDGAVPRYRQHWRSCQAGGHRRFDRGE